MKNLTISSIMFVVCSMFLGCDENEIMPSYQKAGSTTATVASITVSNAAPMAGQSITITMDFVNPAADPVNKVVLRARMGSGSFVDIQSFDEQSAAMDVEISHEVNYVAPSTPGNVTFEMEITSQKEYPQKRRVSISVK